MRFRCITFGCRVNQYETQAIREQLQAKGHVAVPEGEEVDLLIVNSCTVTEAADRECIRSVRVLHKVHPEGKIVVTGCLVQRDADLLKALPGVRLLVGTHQKHRIADWIEEDRETRAWQLEPRIETELSRVYSPLSVGHFAERSKAFLKVQDGCDRSCAFCKIPLVRGRARSRNLSDALEEVRRLVGRGLKEIVLTGVAIGLWGREWHPPRSLADLIDAIDDLPGPFRVRLSSLDPRDLDDRLIDSLLTSRRMCRHLHLSLQSGSDSILNRMNRGYTCDGFRRRVEAIRGHWPDLGLTTDLVVGFPGETQEQFQETLDFCRQMQFAKMHIFPYSRRRGTSAWFFKGECARSLVKERARIARATAAGIAREFRERFVGGVEEVLVEERGAGEGLLLGSTGQFLKVRFSGPPTHIGKLVPVQIVGVRQEGLLGL